jgi:predicted O-linked N-acetylglucosamine transferase (SPINDLY family)
MRDLKAHPTSLTINANRLICLNYLTDRSPREVFDEHAKWGAASVSWHGGAMTHRNDRDPERRLRVGYVSQDFRAHSVCYFILHALKHHDRDKVDVFCYADVSKPMR